MLCNEPGLTPPPIAEPTPPGKIIHNGEYMGKHYTDEIAETEYRTKFYN